MQWGEWLVPVVPVEWVTAPGQEALRMLDAVPVPQVLGTLALTVLPVPPRCLDMLNSMMIAVSLAHLQALQMAG